MDFTTIIQWNCNGFYSHLEEINLLINDLNPYILCLQETHFSETHIPKMKNFNIYFENFTPSHRSCGGVATLIHKNFYSEEIIINSNFQVTAATIYFPFKISICNIYIPPSQPLNKQDLINLINQIPKPILLCGDFNAHNNLWGSTTKNRNGSIIESILNDLDLNLFNNSFSPTHFSSFKGSFSTIDLTISSPEIQPFFNWKTHSDLCSSDHFPIILTSLQKIAHTKRPRWKINRADWLTYQLNIKFEHIHNDSNINEKCNEITKSIINSAQTSIPKTSSTPKKPPVPWWSEQIHQAIKNRNKMLRKFKISPTNENLQLFRIQKARCRKLIRESKKQSWNEFVSSINLNTTSSVIWKKIRSFKALDTPNTIMSLFVNGEMTTNQNHILNEIGSYFESTFSSINYTPTFLHYKNSILSLTLPPDPCDHLEINQPFIFNELQLALSKAKGSSPGHDDIHYEMLKRLTITQKYFILDFYNEIWTKHLYPKTWRHCFIVPIPKPNSDLKFSKSYRPICLSSCLSKTLQRMVSSRLMYELDRRNLLSKNQFGFRRNRSTNDCLILLEKQILETFAQNQHMLAIFFDLEKAYDTAWRDNILRTLHNWNIKGNILHFIQKFLSHRTFQILIGNNKSKIYSQENGVPQGEILSVTLFLISINSISLFIPRHTSFSLFADDLTIAVSSNTVQDCAIKLNETIFRLNNWCNKTGFKFSTTKTKGIHFTRKTKHIVIPPIIMSNSPILFVDSHRYLGLIFDRKLTWKNHLLKLKSETNRQTNILKALSSTNWGADRTTMLRLYQSLILSKLDYGSLIFSSAKLKLLQMLNPIQNTAIRLSLGAFRSSPVDSLHSEAAILPLNFRRNKLIVNHYSKILNSQSHPLYNICKNYRLKSIFNNKPNHPKPFIIRAETIINSINHVSPEFPYLPTLLKPPWLLPKLHINIELLNKFKKNVTPSYEYLAEFNKLLSHHPDYEIFYTDGSKSSSGTGSGIFHENTSMQFRLNNDSSVVTSELYSIWKCLEYITTMNLSIKFLICSDSNSALQMINSNSNNYIIRHIVNCLTRMPNENIVKFIWIPGHTNIFGNERADILAKQATSLPNVEFNYILYEDYRTKTKNLVHKSWENHWQNLSPLTNKLREIKNNISKWNSNFEISRRDSIVITRIRIGHSKITHDFLMAKRDQTMCEICQTPLTIKHIIENCTIYDTSRRKYQITSITQASGNDQLGVEKMLNYLREIDVYSKI